jgi:hypothetical protein
MTRRSDAPKNEVPFLHEKQIEQDVDLLLAEYAKTIEQVSKPPVPVEELVGTVLQLRHRFLDMKALFPFADVHGAIWFEEGLIGVDSLLNPDSFPRRRGRYHFTLAHEIGHWRLHRQFYMKNPCERLLFDDGSTRPDVVCRSSERKKRVEWQADTFAAYLLMPREMVKREWHQMRGNMEPIYLAELRANQSTDLSDELLFEQAARPLAEKFEVSPVAMRIRLEEVKLLARTKETLLF